jgi:DHA1 family inner membrane transport protein
VTASQPAAPHPLPLAGCSLLFAIAFVQVTDSQVIPILLARFGARWPGSDPAGLVVAYTVGAAILPFLITLRAWRFTGRRAVLAGLALLGTADLLFAACEHFALALALRFAAGAASGILAYSTLVVATRGSPRDGGAVTAMTTGFLCALVLGIPGGALVAHFFDPEALFVGLALTALALLPLSRRLLPASTPRDTDPGPTPLARLVSDRRLLAGLVSAMIIAAAIAGPVTLFPAYLQSPEGASLDGAQVGLVYLWAGLGPLLALPLSRRIRRRFTPLALATAGNLLVAVPLLLLPTAGQHRATAAALLLLALLTETLRRSALQTHLALLAPAPDRPRYLTLRGLLAQVGIASGVLLASALTQRFGLAVACGASAALAVLAAGLLLLTRKLPAGDREQVDDRIGTLADRDPQSRDASA